MAQKNKNTEGQPDWAAATEAQAEATANQPAKVTVRLDLVRASERAIAIARKAELFSAADACLSLAASFGSDSEAAEGVASAEADKGATRLYQAYAEGVATVSEIKANLGQIFGYKLTSQGKVSKTPAGKGEHALKRIVRAATALDNVRTDGKDGSDWIKAIPTQLVEPIVNEISNGGSVWSAYNALADARKEHVEKSEPLTDAGKVIAMAEKITGDTITAAIRGSKSLQDAYTSLLEAIVAAMTVEVEAEA